MSPKRTQSRQAGFTLVELSIVLMIIGFMAGGVFFGQEIITQAQIRRTVSQIEKLDTAINAFRLKYDCLPGDCGNATQLGFDNNVIITISENQTTQEPDYYFPNPLISSAYATSVPFPGGAVVTFPKAPIFFNANGNNSGTIDAGFGQEFFVSMYELEATGFLSNLDIATYTMPLAVDAWSPSTGYNAFWGIAHFEHKSLPYGHYYAAITDFGNGDPTAIMNGNAVIKPSIAERIDSKVDDGAPRGGKMLATSSDKSVSRSEPFPFNEFDDVGMAGAESPVCITETMAYNAQSIEGKCAILIRANVGS